MIGWYLVDTGFGSIPNCVCVKYTNEGYVNSFNTGLGTDGFKVEVDLDGEKKYIEGDEQFVTLANGKARVSWVGSLLGINNIGSPNYDVYHKETTWFLVEKNAYTNTATAYNSFKTCMSDSNHREDGFRYCFNTYNNVINQNIVSQNQEYINDISNVESISFSQGILFVDLKQPTFKPLITIELDASQVGIVRLAGKPRIDSCIPDQSFSEAGTDTGSATITNIGNSEGFFDFKITCSNNDMSGHADSLNFDAGQTRTISYQLYGGNSGTDTNSALCKLKVTDRASQDSSLCTFDFDVAYKSGVGDCQGDETKCSGDFKYLFKCVENEWVQVECEKQCDYVGGIAQCTNGTIIIPPDECNSCWNWLKDKLGMEQECKTGFFDKIKNSFFCPFYFLKLAIVIVAGIFGLFFAQQFLEKTFKNIPPIGTWILGIGFAGLIGFLGYTFLEWYFVIPLVIITIIGSIIFNAIPVRRFKR